ncbi:MAG: hypothetical protein J6V50_04790, partial [Clostridia bacterium]|nr:hypothetical protein [Clostridia bacterium]
MLNEIKEYEFYLTRGYGDIIRSKNLKDSLSGIRAILVALARGFIGDCKNEGIFDTEKLHFYTIAFLKVWLVGIEAAIENAANKNDQMLGNTLKEIESYKILSERLKKADAENLLGYMNREKININGKNNTDQTRRGFLFFKLNDWSNPLFPEADNSLNAIRFEAIVADAIFKGELKNSLLRIRETDKSNHGMEGDFGDSRMWVVLGIV